MLVEMGSMLSLNSGVKVYDALKENDKVCLLYTSPSPRDRG